MERAYQTVICDRCGAEVDIEYHPYSAYDKLDELEDWGFLEYFGDKKEKVDLCPDCVKKYNDIIRNFWKERETWK